MLAVFLASLGVSGFNSKRLAHELDHDRQAAITVVDHDHAPPLSTNGNSDPEPLSDTEHRLLHAVNYCEPLPSSTIEVAWEPPARTMPLLSSLPVLPAAELDTPFRPPRSPALI
jgi:hypothetical protein